MQREYKKFEVADFGAILLKSNDLDPVYVVLHRLASSNNCSDAQLHRFLLAYILCYHVGASCWLSEKEGNNFFEWLLIAAANAQSAPLGGRWPRSHERRHWRGQFAINVVGKLNDRYSDRPENFIPNIVGAFTQSPPYPTPFSEIAKRVQSHYGMGAWAAFKLADLIDRVGIAPVDFSYDDVVIYKDPVEAAKIIYRRENNLPNKVEVKPAGVKATFNHYIEYFSDYGAPPLYDRPFGLQECETVFCKIKSHLHGRYPLFNDIREIREGLQDWKKVCRTAQLFEELMPALPEDAAEFIKYDGPLNHRF